MLFSTTAGAGHFGPLSSVARACQDAGHEVVVAAPASFADAVSSVGLSHIPFADVAPDVMGAVMGRLAELSQREAEAVVIGEVFGRLDAQAALPGVTDAIGTWRPDVVVREPCELGSWAAAERAGVPQVEVAISVAAFEYDFLEFLREPLAELRDLAGLPPDPDLVRLRDVPSLTCLPASFDTGESTPGQTFRYRDPAHEPRSGRLPADWGDPSAPLVYVTFGSVAASLPPFRGLYATVRDTFADEPYRVLLTTGRALAPDDLGPWPDNVRAEPWWPQGEVMPLVDVMVGHGGFGTTTSALAAGVPQVVLPLFAGDQFVNAARVEEVGAGRMVLGGPDAAPSLSAAVRTVLGDPSYAQAAAGLARDVADLPPVSAATDVIIGHADRFRA